MSTLRRLFIDTHEGQLHCRHGGSGEPVVLLPTLPFGATPLIPVVQLLAADYECFAIEPMGQWPSDDRSEHWRVEDHAANLLEALDVLGLERVRILAGHFTALVAVDMALRAPWRIRQLVLDGLYAWTPEEKAPYEQGHAPPAPFDDSGDALKQRWESVIAILRRFDPGFTITPDNASLVSRLALGFIANGVGGPPSPSPTFEYALLPRLPELTVPTLLMHSPTDSLRRFNERALKLIPQAREHAFSGINPLQQVTDPARIAEYVTVLREFFASPH
jgi:pimeloyl-ACP methyl ester carboxylesterase